MEWHIKPFEQLDTQTLFALYQLRTAVFVVEQQCAYQEVDEWDLIATHIFAKNRDKLTACCRLTPQTDGVHLGRVAVDKAYRGTGLAREMVQLALDICQQKWTNQPVIIQAQTYLYDFYRTFGFQATSEEYLEDGIAHLDMKLAS